MGSAGNNAKIELILMSVVMSVIKLFPLIDEDTEQQTH